MALILRVLFSARHVVCSAHFALLAIHKVTRAYFWRHTAPRP
jgi:hypothetical protein